MEFNALVGFFYTASIIAIQFAKNLKICESGKSVVTSSMFKAVLIRRVKTSNSRLSCFYMV